MYNIANENIKRELVGEKAYNLHLVYSNDLAKVPESWVIDADEFCQVMRYNNIKKLEEIEGADFFVEMQRIRQKIEGFRCTEGLSLQLDDIITKYKDKRIAVRSSFAFEDNAYSSNAGMFYSSTDNIGKIDVWKAILNTWKSAFSPMVQKKCSTEGIGVLLQPYIEARISGIAFSESYTSEKDILICYKEGSLESMTAGFAESTELLYGKDKICEIKEAWIKDIADVIIKLEKFFGFPVDVEWLIDKYGELYILQCRPIKQNIKNTAKENLFQIMSVDEWNDKCGFPLQGVMEIHAKWWIKKHWVRTHAVKNGFNVSNAIYVHIPLRGLTEKEYCEIKSLFSTKWVEIYADDIGREPILLDTLEEKLKQIKNKTIRLESIVETFNAGIASYDKERDLVITDMAPGSINAIREGTEDPSCAIISVDNLSLNLKTHWEVKRFDTNRGEWRNIRAKKSAFKVTVTEDNLYEIRRMAKSFYESFGKTQVEWIHDGKCVYFFDTSFEDEGNIRVPKEANWISYGSAEAPVIKLEDVTILKDVWSGHISVWRPVEFYETAANVDVSILDSNYRYKEIKPIIVTTSPVTQLALLIDHVAGFIFEKGSVLSHFAIILRENGLPAVFQENCMAEYQTNDWVSIKYDEQGDKENG